MDSEVFHGDVRGDAMSSLGSSGRAEHSQIVGCARFVDRHETHRTIALIATPTHTGR
jgi:hypothetical protein